MYDTYIRNHAAKEEADDYWQASRLQKQRKREKWYEKKLAVETEKFSATQTMSHTDKSKGKFMSMRMISKKLGGDPAGAMRYVKACIAIGPSEYYLEGIYVLDLMS